jgi:hypothetical protein
VLIGIVGLRPRKETAQSEPIERPPIKTQLAHFKTPWLVALPHLPPLPMPLAWLGGHCRSHPNLIQQLSKRSSVAMPTTKKERT